MCVIKWRKSRAGRWRSGRPGLPSADGGSCSCGRRPGAGARAGDKILLVLRQICLPLHDGESVVTEVLGGEARISFFPWGKETERGRSKEHPQGESISITRGWEWRLLFGLHNPNETVNPAGFVHCFRRDQWELHVRKDLSGLASQTKNPSFQCLFSEATLTLCSDLSSSSSLNCNYVCDQAIQLFKNMYLLQMNNKTGIEQIQRRKWIQRCATEIRWILNTSLTDWRNY